jgi:hypothetical protein
MIRRFRIATIVMVPALATAGLAHAQDVAGSQQWPDQRQHLLAGHYIGQVRDSDRENQPCEYLDADLDLRFSRRHEEIERTYSLVLKCPGEPTMNRKLKSTWWDDVIAGDCLILQPELGPNPEHPWNEGKLFGFRIEDDANALYLDGGGCEAADERDAGVGLRRVPFPFDATTLNR